MTDKEHAPLSSRAHVLLGLALVVAAFIAALIGSMRSGMAWDEGFYYPAYVDAWEWTKLLVGSPGSALSGEGVHAGWSHVNELPPVTRWIGMVGVALQIGPTGELLSMRLPFLVLFATTLAVLWFAGWRLSPRHGY